ncbi:hypothetical protein [Lysobacter gummosus]
MVRARRGAVTSSAAMSPMPADRSAAQPSLADRLIRIPATRRRRRSRS